ncbi:MAG: prepilin-type N-terminal cleavage/methylation domain-containing protein [Eubacteriaceae bacterium]|jgi:type IV pilus assembly protein PilA|nr:prepilin-type N-terminal cleavage/methylation domain-containing protein [Eubacteriaceae bacterium]
MEKMTRTINELQMGKKPLSKKGFTLVEIIVVLVILAILAAILIPSMVGYIDKANSKTAVVEARSCVMAAQTVVSENYKTGTTSAVDDTMLADINNLAEMSDKCGVLKTTDITLDGAKIATLKMTSSNGKVVTYTRSTGKYTVQ